MKDVNAPFHLGINIFIPVFVKDLTLSSPQASGVCGSLSQLIFYVHAVARHSKSFSMNFFC